MSNTILVLRFRDETSHWLLMRLKAWGSLQLWWVSYLLDIPHYSVLNRNFVHKNQTYVMDIVWRNLVWGIHEHIRFTVRWATEARLVTGFKTMRRYNSDISSNLFRKIIALKSFYRFSCCFEAIQRKGVAKTHRGFFGRFGPRKP